MNKAKAKKSWYVTAEIALRVTAESREIAVQLANQSDLDTWMGFTIMNVEEEPA